MISLDYWLVGGCFLFILLKKVDLQREVSNFLSENGTVDLIALSISVQEHDMFQSGPL